MKDLVCMTNLSHHVRSLPLTSEGDAMGTKLCMGRGGWGTGATQMRE